MWSCMFVYMCSVVSGGVYEVLYVCVVCVVLYVVVYACVYVWC